MKRGAEEDWGGWSCNVETFSPVSGLAFSPPRVRPARRAHPEPSYWLALTSLGELRSCAWTKNTGPLMSEITPETLLAAGALILLLIAVWWGGKAVKGWFWTCYAVLMVLALAYALWRWLG